MYRYTSSILRLDYLDYSQQIICLLYIEITPETTEINWNAVKIYIQATFHNYDIVCSGAEINLSQQ